MSHWKDVAAYIKDTSTTRHKQDRPELLPRLLIPFQSQISQKKIANKKNCKQKKLAEYTESKMFNTNYFFHRYFTGLSKQIKILVK